jgi:hypothetical protein
VAHIVADQAMKTCWKPANEAPGRLIQGDDPQPPFLDWKQLMSRIVIALCLLLTAQQAIAAECGSTANRAGCVGANGAASVNKNTGEVHGTQSNGNYHSNQVAPGTTAQGRRGNSATKAVEPGCAFVNGRRVCN